MIHRINYFASTKQTGEVLSWNLIYDSKKPQESALIKKIYDIIKKAVDRPKCGECFEAAGATPIIK